MSERARHFGSDNYAGICPEAWAAMEEANQGHSAGYGDDRWTAEAERLIQDFFETDCQVYFVFNGTAANALALAASCRSYHSILCHRTAHVEVDECGAPEFFTGGAKVIRLPGENGKVTPSGVRSVAEERKGDVHFSKARALTITQATEVGTLYRPAEVAELGALCKEKGMHLHMDGARFANAFASLGEGPRSWTWEAGVDVLSLGGSKSGMGVGDAVVFFNRDLSEEFAYRRKQAGQLASKMRFLSAPWIGMLRDGAWGNRAAHANGMALKLAGQLEGVDGLRILYPVEANAVFLDMAPERAESLWAKGWKFYEFPACGGYRLMCAWDTREEDIDAFVGDLLAT